DSVASSTPIRRGRADLVRPGADGAIVAAGAFVEEALAAARGLATGPKKLDVGVINARFVKPIDRQTILDPLRRGGFLVTVEDGVLAGGFGSAVLEAACDERLDTRRLKRLGIGDQYVPHGSRGELLRLLEIDAEGITAACAALASGTRGERE
ncbi:MAG: 1-deoxy-D-xylulose-5-phosphate synthase, partial [Thermoguttaceae bacterium]|nr:1-deoxy-D-xylulose-5-phosphate synthase [Thermoguttaceae bacterium]